MGRTTSFINHGCVNAIQFHAHSQINRAESAGCAGSAEVFDVLEVGNNAAQICKCATHLFSANADSICELAVRPGALAFFSRGGC